MNLVFSVRLSFAKKALNPTNCRDCVKSWDTTGFSRVELQFYANRRSLLAMKTPPTLVAWSFNFCHLALDH